MRILTSLVLMAASATLMAGEHYKITTTYPGDKFDGKEVKLIDFDTDTVMASAIVQGGKVVVEGEIEGSCIANLSTAGAGGYLVVEKGEITLVFDESKPRSGTAQGTELNSRFNKFFEDNAKSNNVAFEIAIRLRNNEIDTQEAQRLRDSLSVDMSRRVTELYKNNLDNGIGRWAFVNYLMRYDDLAQVKAFLAEVPKSYATLPKVKAIYDRAAAKSVTAVGSKFIDFEVEESAGVTTRLSDYVGKGKMVILDFWASWCGPCRREARGLKEIYAKYRDKGLEIVGVAVHDRPDDTKRAIEQQQLPWVHIINAQDVPGKLYGFTEIPQIYIIDGEGTIIAKGLHGEELKAKVEELMSK